MSGLIVGIDIGTSSVKTGLFDLEGRMIATSQAAYGLFSPRPEWAEQNPADWWISTMNALQEIMEDVDPSQVSAVGLCGQCPGQVLVDDSDTAIGNAIIWRDRRAQKEIDWLIGNITEEQSLKWIGTTFGDDAGSPPARLLWLKENRSGDWGRTRVILQPKDYIGLLLTGEAKTDIHSAYCLFNPITNQYEEAYFDYIGIPLDKMPAVLSLTDTLGQVTKKASKETGLPQGTPVIVGTIDAWCDNLAGGIAFQEGAVDISGTSEMISMYTEKTKSDDRIYVADLGNELKFLCGPSQAGGDTLRWLWDGFFQHNNPERKFQVLQSLAGEVPAGSEGVIFLPYLYGERAPLWDSSIRAGFLGLNGSHDVRHCVRAVYEGVGFAVRHILEIIEQSNGREAEWLTICGGGAQSIFWNQIKADILQRSVKPVQVIESACFGAAILASVGIGIYSDLKKASLQMVHFKDPIEPELAYADEYHEVYQRYLDLYPQLKPVFTTAK